MHIYAEVYEFAASAGAFEGYVYPGKDRDHSYLPNWVDHLLVAYQALPDDVCNEFQSSLDGTLGRAVRALIPVFGEDHEIIRKLKSMIMDDLPESVDDFQKKKWFEK